MSGKMVYLVYEGFDNCQSYEDHDYAERVIAVCTTKEIAERFMEERCNQLLNAEYDPHIEWRRNFNLTETERIEHKVVAKMRHHDDSTWDIFVWTEDESIDVWEPYTGAYTFGIIEQEQDKLLIDEDPS